MIFILYEMNRRFTDNAELLVAVSTIVDEMDEIKYLESSLRI